MSYDIVQEDVPPFVKRVGDYILQGSNNTMVILGTDRAKKGPAKIGDGLGHVDADGKGKGTGTVHLIAGRQDKDGNPDLDKDLAYLYLSMKTDVDTNTGLDGIEKDAGKVPAAVLKADAVRIVVRKDLKIAFDGTKSYIHLTKDSCTLKIEDQGFIKIVKDKITLEGKTIELGKDAAKHFVRYEAFSEIFDKHLHPTGTGPSGPPNPPNTAALRQSSSKDLSTETGPNEVKVTV